MKKTTAALCLLFSLTVATHAAPENEKRVVDRPQVSVGTTWVFTRLDSYTGLPISTETEKVMAFSGTEITVDSSTNGTIVYNSDWNPVAHLDGGARTALRMFRPSLAFPLMIGKKWKWRANFTNAAGQQLSYGPEAEVIGWEKVVVPAGTFEALLIKSSGSYYGTGFTGSFSGAFQETYWYSPEAGRVVKYQFQNSAGTRYTTELTSYQMTSPKASAAR